MTAAAEQKHTPGPWHAEGPDYFGDFNIHEPNAQLAVAAVVSNLRPDSEVAANARLAAAAPDMLQALKDVLQHVEDETVERVNGQCTLCRTYRDMIRAAIAKAEAS